VSLKKTAKYLSLFLALALLLTASCAAIYRYIAQTKISRARAASRQVERSVAFRTSVITQNRPMNVT
jgi:hypothetical protein